MSDEAAEFYMYPNESEVYTEVDRDICDLDCRILNNCQQGIVPKIEDVESCTG